MGAFLKLFLQTLNYPCSYQ